MAPVIFCAALLAGTLLITTSAFAAEQPESSEGAGQVAPVCEPSVMDSPYVPVDSWVYQAVLRLYGLGFVDNVFLGMRPYTRASLSNMLDQASARIQDADSGPETDSSTSLT